MPGNLKNVSFAMTVGGKVQVMVLLALQIMVEQLINYFLFKIKKDIMLIIIILKPTIDSIVDSLNEKYNIQIFVIKYKIGTNG